MKRVFYFCMTLTLALSLVLASCPFKASASSVVFPFDVPYSFPLDSPVWSADDIFDGYDDLTYDQKRALDYLIGSSGSVYGVNRGLSVDGVIDAASWLCTLGERINTYIMSLPYQALDANSPLRRNLSNLIDYVSTSVSSTFESWYDSIVRLGYFGTVYNSDYAQGWTDLIGSSDITSIDSWQNYTKPFEYMPSFVDVKWSSIPSSVSGHFSRFPYLYRLKNNGSVLVYTSSPLHLDAVYYNTTTSKFQFVYDGVVSDTIPNIVGQCLSVYLDNNGNYVDSYFDNSNTIGVNTTVPSSLTTLHDVAIFAMTNTVQYNWIDYIKFSSKQVQFLVGASYSTALPLKFDDSLGILFPSLSRTVVYNPAVPVAIDALDIEKAIVGDYTESTAREFVEAVALSLDDAQATTWNREAVAVSVSDSIANGSGLSIPSTFFNGFISYIDYLWSFAEPLVLYTRDLLTCLSFDGQGIAWIFFGVCSLGVIGGVVYKFLQ